MTGQAPLHFQRAGAPGQRHLVDTTMARRTADALVDVDAVIKIDKVRKIVNALPRERRCGRSEEHPSELQSPMRTSYSVICLKNTKHITKKIDLNAATMANDERQQT